MSTTPDPNRTTLSHTPGPWSQSHRECADGMWNTQVYDANGEAIATLHWYPFQDGNVTHTLREKNAQLIAAAPEMLAKLKEIHAGMNCICKFLPFVGKDAPCEVCQIELVIAKAEGR